MYCFPIDLRSEVKEFTLVYKEVMSIEEPKENMVLNKMMTINWTFQLVPLFMYVLRNNT